MLVPYTRRSFSMTDPFRSFDELERSFFGAQNLGEFRTDIREDGDAFVLEADLPGFRKEDIHVDLSGDALTITAERHSDYEQKDKRGNFLRCERSYGSCSRSFDLTGIEKSAIKARYQDGVLSLRLPKQTPPEETSTRLTIE